ncbi:MAG TPA: hypothetical protein VHO48_13320 [Anaerolineaceae bacterium]|nr:hypothetical protein [Anaerolineaceae bacterium]
MGRTLPSAAIQFQIERERFEPFKRALSRRDQRALEELFVFANCHVAEAAYAAHTLPMETFLLAMLLEVHKELMQVRRFTTEPTEIKE